MPYKEKDWNGKRRGELDIINNILKCSLKFTGKTEIMYKANLSFSQLGKYLNLLTSAALLVEKNDIRVEYRTTEKGKKFIEKYEEIEKILASDSKA
ncbi:MAG: winged helix-turn-helix domain-containing protein [Candidatus Aenigmatarchaeota archaeon]